MKGKIEKIIIILGLGSVFIIGFCWSCSNCSQNEIMSLIPIKTVLTPVSEQESPKNVVVGISSWYDYSLNGIEWSKNHNTAASRDFPRYSMVRVTNLANGKSVDVYINDYIEHPERDIDLSSFAFSQIASLSLGLINVKMEQL